MLESAGINQAQAVCSLENRNYELRREIQQMRQKFGTAQRSLYQERMRNSAVEDKLRREISFANQKIKGLQDSTNHKKAMKATRFRKLVCKTKMCEHILEGNACAQGHHCTFAHHGEELSEDR